VAVIGFGNALVDILARLPVARVTDITGAGKPSRSISAISVFVAIVKSVLALVYVSTTHTIAGITRNTTTDEVSDGVFASRLFVAVIGFGCALVDILALRYPVSRVPRFTPTQIRTHRIFANSVFVAFEGFFGAFVDVNAGLSRTRKA